MGLGQVSPGAGFVELVDHNLVQSSQIRMKNDFGLQRLSSANGGVVSARRTPAPGRPI
jgi:hypothetical protein